MARIAIVGAGIFGVTAAGELTRRGHSVALHDPGPLPHPLAASTDLSKIVRLDYGADEVTMALMEHGLSGWRAWNARRAGQRLPPLFHETGLLLLSRRALAPGGFEHDSLELLKRRGHPARRLSAADLAREHPLFARATAGGFCDGYFNPQGGWAESGATVAWLIDELRAAGAAVREGAAVHGDVAVHEGAAGAIESVDALQASGADLVLVAAGVWTPRLLPESAPWLRINAQPVLLLAPANPERLRPPALPPFTADIAQTGLYGFPALPDGTLKVAVHGAGRDCAADAPRDLPAEDEAQIRALLAELLPSLAEAPRCGGRLCLYDDTPDGQFLIDRVPGRPRVVVAAGGSGHAFKFAPVLGPLIAAAAEEALAALGHERAAPAGRGTEASQPWLAEQRRRCRWDLARLRPRPGGDAARSAVAPRRK
ncbi:MAG: FAD-dependent oxidoreductase [Planctomycetota bacterium]